LKAVVKLQSLVRRSHARKVMVAHAKGQGVMLALAGTINGKSGWYEFRDGATGAAMVARFAVNRVRNWELTEGPIVKGVYFTAKRTKEQEARRHGSGRVGRLQFRRARGQGWRNDGCARLRSSGMRRY
jgi:hypothetical protein